MPPRPRLTKRDPAVVESPAGEPGQRKDEAQRVAPKQRRGAGDRVGEQQVAEAVVAGGAARPEGLGDHAAVGVHDPGVAVDEHVVRPERG